LFLAAQQVGLEIYDITDPIQPSFVGCYFSEEGIEDIYVENRYAYLTTYTNCVRVIDLSIPSFPSLVGTYHSRDNPGKLMVKEEHIYLCDNRSFKILKFNPPIQKSKDQFLEDVAYPFELEQNYPNSFNPTTTIPFRVKSLEFREPVHTTREKVVHGSRFVVHGPSHTTLTIYNVLGQKVRTLVDKDRMLGNYQVDWDGKDETGKEVASGVYFYKLKVENFEKTKKMLLIR